MATVGMVKGCIANAIFVYPLCGYKGEEFKDHHKFLKGSNDILNLTQPHIISEIHIVVCRSTFTQELTL